MMNFLRLRNKRFIKGGGYVHWDTTYFGRNLGVLLALDNATRKPLYLEFINHETIDGYSEALDSIEKHGLGTMSAPECQTPTT